MSLGDDIFGWSLMAIMAQFAFYTMVCNIGFDNVANFICQ